MAASCKPQATREKKLTLLVYESFLEAGRKLVSIASGSWLLAAG
jgi:hypothetical protein